MNSCLINLPSGNNGQKKHTLTVSIPKRNTGENRELIDAEVKSIKEKLATLETAAVITTTEEFHVDIREIILKLKDDTLSTLEKHTALASILDYMEYDKEKNEYSFYYKFEAE